MRRIAVFLAVVSLFLFGFGFGVNAQSSGPAGSAPSQSGSSSPASRHIQRELRKIRSLAPGVNVCSTIQAGSDVSKLIECLNKVTKFAKATQKELTALNKFVEKFFNCTSYTQVTWRGVQPGAAGYVFDLGTGTTEKRSALDVAQAGDGFTNFYVLKDTTACIVFSGG